MEASKVLSLGTVKPSSKVSSGPLPLSFFGEEEESDTSSHTVAASTGSNGALDETISNGEQKESETFVDKESERDSVAHGLDTDDDLDFGDFESVPAQLPTASSSSHIHMVDASRLMLQLHGVAIPAAVQHHSDIQLDPRLQSMPGDGFDNVPSTAWPASQRSGSEVISNGIHVENGPMMGHVDKSMSDDEWGDFVAPVPSLSTTNFLKDAASGVHISNYGTPVENVSTTAAGGDASQPLGTETGPTLLSTLESVTSGLQDPFFFDDVVDVTNISSVTVEKPGNNLGQNVLKMEGTDLKIEGTSMSTPLDLFGDNSSLWDSLTPLELGPSQKSHETKMSTSVPDFDKSSNEVEVLPTKELEDEEVWDWVAADPGANHAEAHPMDVANGVNGFSISEAVVSNNTANRKISSGKTDSEQVSFSAEQDAATSSGLIGASVGVQSTLPIGPEAGSDNVQHIGAPLPLSLFGEDEVEYNPSLDLEPEFILNGEPKKSESIKRTQSFKLRSSNFSDLIASLYPHREAPDNNSLKKASHRRSRSTSIQVSSSDDVDFFFSKVNSHPLESPLTEQNGQDGFQASLKSDVGILLSYNSMLDADATSEEGVDDDAAVGPSVSSPPQGKGLGSHGTPVLEDILNMDVHAALDESVSIEDLYLGGFSFQYTDEGDLGTEMTSVKPINVDDRGNDTISALQKLTVMLIAEGRVREANYCKKHISAVSCLPHLQEAYSNALEVGEFEKAAAVAKELEVARTKLARAEDLRQWQSRERHVKACPVDQPALDRVCRGGLSVITINEMVELLGDRHSDTRAAGLMSLFDAQKVNNLAESDLEAAVELQAHAVHTFRILACASIEEQELCVTAWGQLASICVSELEHASYIWESAVNTEAQTRLLNMTQGKSFFAAVGQIYAVCCVLSASLKVYKPWLDVAEVQGQAASKALERCHKVWLESSLKDAVRISLVSSIHRLPMTAASWVEIQKLPRAAKSAIIQAAGRSISDRRSYRFCGLSLLPLLPFTAIPAVEWEGRHYLLPLANLWANTISSKAPRLPLLNIGEVRAS